MHRISWYMLAAVVLLAGCARPVRPLPDLPTLVPTPAPPIVFPRDAGPHDALTEWWYYTGHLHSDDGRVWGFEFTVFQARRQGAPAGYLVHFAVTDVDGQAFSHQSRFAPGEPASDFPLDVNGWSLSREGSSDVIQAEMDAGPGAEAPYGMQLRLVDEKPPVLHHGGYIDYGPAGGSYYYSRTRLDVTGDLWRVGGPHMAVSGTAWMDHQWGNFIIASAGGWDWYSLQLDDRTEMMLYVLRSPDGQSTQVYGTLVAPDGTARELEPGSVRAEATGDWTSPHTGAVYPSGWHLTLPDGGLLIVRPQVEDQELWFPAVGARQSAVGVTAYWEGAVSVSGARTGVGYVELTGYAP